MLVLERATRRAASKQPTLNGGGGHFKKVVENCNMPKGPAKRGHIVAETLLM